MRDHLKLEDLIRAANTGDKKAEERLYEKLFVRFSKVITLELQKYPVLANGVNLDQKTTEICHCAIEEVKKVCSFDKPGSSIIQAMNVLHNVVDTNITNMLADLAKQGNEEAENLLFSIIRNKLMERIITKRGNDAK